MAGQITGYGSRIALDFITKRTMTYVATGNQYLMALTQAPPSDDCAISALTELSATGYARQAVSWAASATPSDATQPTVTATSATLLYGPFTSVTGSGAAPVTHLALVEPSTGTSGGVIMTWVLDSPASAAQGESLQIAAAALAMGMN